MLTLLALVCWSTVSILWATNKDAALVKTSTFLGLFGLALTIGLLKERELKLLWAIVALGMVLSIPLGYALSEPEEISCQWPVHVGRPASKRLWGTAGDRVLRHLLHAKQSVFR